MQCKIIKSIVFLTILLLCLNEEANTEQDPLIEEFERIQATYKNLSITYGQELPPDYPPINKFEDSYDFIVIGAGSAGSVVASRLSEVPEWTTLLLEAGDQPPIGSEIPAASFYLFATKENWNFMTETIDNFGYGFVNRQLPFIRGRGLGGCSLINGMYATRGSPLDYDKWAQQQGNRDWSWQKVLPYFKKMEDFRIENGDRGYHRQGGYLTIEDVKSRTVRAEVFVNSTIESGLKYVDYNGRQVVGVGYTQGTIRHGRRCSTEKAYLRPAKVRKNLAIVPNARVTKILINPHNKTAYGVEVYYNKTIFTILARKEVILSAGAVQSPQLLMLSGVGPRYHLQKFGIPVIKDLPVGQKLYDHLFFLGLVFTVNDTITTDVNRSFSQENLENLVRHGDGPLVRMFVGGEAISFHNTTNKQSDFELLLLSASFSSRAFLKAFHLTDEMFNAVLAPNSTQPLIQIAPILLHPKSYGFIELKSNNSFDPPKIQPNYLTDREDHDVKVLLEAIRYIQQLIKMPSFQKYNTTLLKSIQPGCEEYRYDSDDYWRCCIRGLSSAVYHPIGTCKMGPFWDPEAVVDAQLRVHGIKQLRVIDASVMPTTISGHTNLPAIMIGERGADFIKSDHNEPISL